MLFLCCQLLFVCLLAANKFEPCPPQLTSTGRHSIINVTVVIVVVDAAAAATAAASSSSAAAM